jgi:hypothetical protein
VIVVDRQPVLATSLAPNRIAPRIARDELERHMPPHFERRKEAAPAHSTELITNAVIHAHSVVDLELYVDGDQIYVPVVDH